MAHLLLLDLPGGNDFTILEDAVRMGHQVTFCTSDLAHYQRQGDHANSCLTLVHQVLEIAGFDYDTFEQRVMALHALEPFGAVLCLIDIRLIEASRIADRLGLLFLEPAVAVRLRDKVAVREALAAQGIRQPAFAAATSADEVVEAVTRIGYPVVVKPADGYGSQEVSLLESSDDLIRLVAGMREDQSAATDYGFGVRASRHWSVEQYIRGHMVGCDFLVSAQERLFLGVNDKVMMKPPSFAMGGSCFPSQRHDLAMLQAYALRILDAVGFNFGATHIEMIVAEDGPYLVEINPRLVSAQIPFQMGYALGASLYEGLIDLHLGHPLGEWRARDAWHNQPPAQFCAIRWLTSDREGTVAAIEFPLEVSDRIRRVVAFRNPGDRVRPPRNNGDRVLYVMAVGETQALAEASAEALIAEIHLRLD